jgi:hypothetical protein
MPHDNRRKRNCLKIATALKQAAAMPQVSRNWSFADPEIWVNWIDPLSPQNYQKTQKGDSHHTFYFRSVPVHIPMDWFWREIEEWEINGLVVEIKLQLSLKQNTGPGSVHS